MVVASESGRRIHSGRDGTGRTPLGDSQLACGCVESTCVWTATPIGFLAINALLVDGRDKTQDTDVG